MTATGTPEATSALMPAHGTAEMLRETVVELFGLIAIQADLGAGHASIADDVAASYCLRRVVGYVRAALPTLAELCEQFPQPEGRRAKEWTTREEPL